MERSQLSFPFLYKTVSLLFLIKHSVVTVAGLLLQFAFCAVYGRNNERYKEV